MSFIINRVFPRYRERLYNDNELREFELQCANKCQNLTPREFKSWLEFEVDLELLKIFAARKCNYRTSRDLTIYEIDQCVYKIIEYIYRIYRSNYFTSLGNTNMTSIDGSSDGGHNEEEQGFESEMVHLLQSLRNSVTPNEAPTNEMMTAALDNDMRSAMLFYDMMASINSRRETTGLMRETTGLKRKFVIELEEEKEEEKEIECFVCFESISTIKCIKQNCSHECCAKCLIKTINVDKRPEALCAICRTPIENLIVKSIDLKNELNKLYN
jgi:hypothetical protein